MSDGVTSGGETDTAECEFCHTPVTPVNPQAMYHICKECLKMNVQVGNPVEINE